MLNHKLVGRKSIKDSPAVHPVAPKQQAVEIAIRNVLSPEDSNRVIQGFRRSITSQEALIEDYKLGDIVKHKIIKDGHYQKALELTLRKFAPKEKYRPVSFPDLRSYPFPLSSSAEAPFTTDPGIKACLKDDVTRGINTDERPTFHNLYNRIFEINRKWVHYIKDGRYTDDMDRPLHYWNTAHARSHLVKSKDPDKIRMVYGVPKLLIMVECMFLWPLIVSLVERDGPMLWGYETLKGGWHKLFTWAEKLKPKRSTWLALDWKGFDKRASFDVIDDLHKGIRQYIDFENGYFPTIFYPETETDPQRLERLWDWMCQGIKYTPDLLPNGEMYQRQHSGIASGFFQTQILGSMYNTLMLLTCLSKIGIDIETVELKVQGDDSLIGLVESIPEVRYSSFLDNFAIVAKTYFGAILSVKKSTIGNSLNGLPVLGFTNNHGYPTRDKYSLLASLLYPEHQTDQARLMARAIGIAWADCGNHSDVYKVCEFVYDYFKSKGFLPNMKGIPDLLKSTEVTFLLDENQFPNYFPSWYDTIKCLRSEHIRTQAQRNKLWNSELFLFMP